MALHYARFICEWQPQTMRRAGRRDFSLQVRLQKGAASFPCHRASVDVSAPTSYVTLAVATTGEQQMGNRRRSSSFWPGYNGEGHGAPRSSSCSSPRLDTGRLQGAADLGPCQQPDDVEQAAITCQGISSLHDWHRRTVCLAGEERGASFEPRQIGPESKIHNLVSYVVGNNNEYEASFGRAKS